MREGCRDSRSNEAQEEKEEEATDERRGKDYYRSTSGLASHP